jgi:hypothetical protein
MTQSSDSAEKPHECFDYAHHERKFSNDFNPSSVRPETCMMDVEPDRESSCTMAMAKAIEVRRDSDEKQNIHANGLRCVWRIGR